jgi:hypothetical protein
VAVVAAVQQASCECLVVLGQGVLACVQVQPRPGLLPMWNFMCHASCPSPPCRVRWCVLATPRLPAFVAGSEPMRFEAIST